MRQRLTLQMTYGAPEVQGEKRKPPYKRRLQVKVILIFFRIFVIYLRVLVNNPDSTVPIVHSTVIQPSRSPTSDRRKNPKSSSPPGGHADSTLYEDARSDEGKFIL